MAVEIVTLTQLRDHLGKYTRATWRAHRRFVISKNGREIAGLVPVSELNLLDSAAGKSLEFKALQIAEEMQRWRIVREGFEEMRALGRFDRGVQDD